MRKTFYLVVVILLAALVLAACGGGGDTSDPGVEAGKAIFEESVVGELPGCASCHTVDGSELVGPSLQGIGSRDEAYIRESIVDPEVVIVDGFDAGTMLTGYGDQLTAEELDQLVAYLLSLK